ncbi:unnamed protein product [Miscanthus lutarioriparius]|uniref:tryptophan synthase n=1 Tax=Miscanthus lutarioriparius TaxID=422564 RepID=A0A811MLD1_9POAL|nr:unnamed protein product [Miscanthus lutarioriparius]
MASAIKAASTSRWSSSLAVQSSPLPKRVAMPGRRRSVATVRAVAGVAPAALAAPAKLTGAGGRRRLTVSQTMSKLREQGKTAFIPYITAGDPDLATTAEALRLLDACGADVIELGVPFSDPYADGPDAGVHGLLVPDLPYGTSCALRSEAIKNNLELVLLTTPSTPADRMEEITKASQGFVYLVSVNGVTGSRADVNTRVESLIQEVKQVTDKPVAVGFGVSTPEHVKQIAGWGADGVIIGSAIVRQLCEAATPEDGLKRLEEYTRSIKAAMP